jgi:hypothetical protein
MSAVVARRLQPLRYYGAHFARDLPHLVGSGIVLGGYRLVLAMRRYLKVGMAKEGHKYIFVLGGVMSGVGKGVVTSSMGLLLQQKGYPVNLVKIDPYLNVDAGTMNPTEHGECSCSRAASRPTRTWATTSASSAATSPTRTT